MPDLTVVVCTLGERRLERTIESIEGSARAAGRDVEVVVVWQGGEAPPALGARVLDGQPPGLSQARNRGTAEARSPLVGFVDDDEVVGEGWVAAALEELGDAPGAFGPVLSPSPGERPYFDPGSGRRLFSGAHTAPWVVGTGGNMAFRREALERAGGFDPRFGAGGPAAAAEETDLIMRLLKTGETLVYSPRLAVYHPARERDEELDARRQYAFGMGAALRRSPLLAGKYAFTILQETGRAARSGDPFRRRAVRATLRGFLAGLTARLS
jgi:Glycosyltransferase like family 2